MPFADPFERSSPFGNFGRRRQEPGPLAQPFDPEESASIGRQILDVGKGGLHQFLGAIDKPHQVATHLLAGQPLAALRHAVPFAHAMGLTGDNEEITGRDLLDMYGVTNKKDKGWGAWGAGLAADIATDPLTFLPLGPTTAATKLGKVAKGLGEPRG